MDVRPYLHFEFCILHFTFCSLKRSFKLQFITVLIPHQQHVQSAAVKDDADAAVQPQHTQANAVQRAIEILAHSKPLQINFIQPGKEHPAAACQHGTGQNLTEAAAVIGQSQKHGSKKPRLQQ